MVGSWIAYGLGLGGALAFHAWYSGWFSWFVLLLALCLPLFTFLVSILSMVRVRVQVEVPERCVRGEPVYAALRAENGFLPMPRCRFRLVTTAVMTGKSRKIRQQVPEHGSWYAALDTTHGGAIRCTVEKARVYDYLGLFWIPVRLPPPVEVLVEPEPTEPERLPNLSHFLARAKRPKPGGGFSEEHELRDYRPGDSMRDIHWKLSVKTDRTIVREAQEPIRGLTLLTFDLKGNEDQVDSTLEQLQWLSRWLLDHDAPHQILWIDPTDCQLATAVMEEPEDLEALVDRLLRTPLREDIPSIAGRQFPRASWRCHVEPAGEKGGAE